MRVELEKEWAELQANRFLAFLFDRQGDEAQIVECSDFLEGLILEQRTIRPVNPNGRSFRKGYDGCTIYEMVE